MSRFGDFRGPSLSSDANRCYRSPSAGGGVVLRRRRAVIVGKDKERYRGLPTLGRGPVVWSDIANPLVI